MTYKNYIFDLDGTLTDPGLGIKNSIRYSLNKAGLPIPPESILNEFIGPPLINSYRLFCGANDEEAKTLAESLKGAFADLGVTVAVSPDTKNASGREILIGDTNRELSDEGKTPVYFSQNGRLCGIIAVADTLKEDSASAVSELVKLKKKVIMLTGDNERTAHGIAKGLTSPLSE